VPASWLARRGPLGVRRSALLAAGIVFLVIVAGGVGARALLEPAAPEAKAAALKPSTSLAIPPVPGPEQKSPESSPAKKLAARVDRKFERIEKQTPIPAGVGRLELAVAPWGEVLVDGKNRGVSPPLRLLDVAPGAHTIEIRNSTFPAHVERIQVKAGEAVRIRHRFR
jgi:eukaryotic-like serine/threonine-protein kinase